MIKLKKFRESNFGSTLFLVGSPFQCLCMLEAIEYFNIRDYKVLIIYSDSFSIGKIEKLLNENNISYSKKKVSHLFYGIIPILFSRRKHYKNVFIGYLYSESFKAIANIFASFNGRIYILDDGVQALSFFSASPRKINYKFSIRLVLFFYKLIGLIKFLKRPLFFTIFDVTSPKYKIVKNPFILLRSKLKEPRKQDGIYIIGTNSSKLQFKDRLYEEYLEALDRNVSQRFPNDTIYYCPHRGDQNLERIYTLCRKKNIEIFDTKISVEYDFIEGNISPKLIVGFTSNALYTLRILYPNAEIETVMYHLMSVDADRETCVIRDKMGESGIKTINVF